MYQIFHSKASIEGIRKVLLKALMNLRQNAFTLALYLIPEKQVPLSLSTRPPGSSVEMMASFPGGGAQTQFLCIFSFVFLLFPRPPRSVTISDFAIFSISFHTFRQGRGCSGRGGGDIQKIIMGPKPPPAEGKHP